jgi:hypothetical protein
MKICGRDGLAARASSALLWGVVLTQTALAQEPPPPLPTRSSTPTRVPSGGGQGGGLSDLVFHKSPYEVWLTLLIITFGLVVLGLYIYAIRNITDRRPDDVSRALIVITVITGSLLLITAGYTNEQVAPAFGLFGTIIGYMLGRMNHPAAAEPSEKSAEPAAPKEGEK